MLPIRNDDESGTEDWNPSVRVERMSFSDEAESNKNVVQAEVINAFVNNALERFGGRCSVAISGVLAPDRYDQRIWKRDWIVTVYQQG